MDDLFQIFSLDNEQFPSVVYRRGGDLSPGGQPGPGETASRLGLRVGQGEGGGGERREVRVFTLFYSRVTDQRMAGWTDQKADGKCIL